MTGLFADVKSSMSLSEQVDAETWHRILDRFFSILTEGVHRFEGTVNQYTARRSDLMKAHRLYVAMKAERQAARVTRALAS